MEEAKNSGFARHFELAATMLLAIAAVATAWAAYQAARWRGEQARPRAARSPPASSRRARRTWPTGKAQIDVALFTQWVDAYARDETELATSTAGASARSSSPAFNAWVATKPRTNLSAPLSPFAMPQYKLAANTEADRLEAKAAAFSVRSGAYIQRADNYSLAGVLFAVSLFFAGISTRLHGADGAHRGARARQLAVRRHRDLDRDAAGDQRLGVGRRDARVRPSSTSRDSRSPAAARSSSPRPDPRGRAATRVLGRRAARSATARSTTATPRGREGDTPPDQPAVEQELHLGVRPLHRRRRVPRRPLRRAPAEGEHRQELRALPPHSDIDLTALRELVAEAARIGPPA